ncbi:MAG: hypothetical protein KJ714_10105 [Euryarchaeota archaeon]|nr:hypothetical protein [Euryarchaeota archaeon]
MFWYDKKHELRAEFESLLLGVEIIRIIGIIVRYENDEIVGMTILNDSKKVGRKSPA